MNNSTLLIMALLFFVGAGLSWYIKPPERVYYTEAQQRQIDSLTVALNNTIATRESLRDSLSGTSEAFREYILEHEGEIATLTTIRGRLNTQIDALRDSLQQAQDVFTPIYVVDDAIQDTTIEVTRTFGDSLFQVTSRNEFRDNEFRDSLDLQQLRELRIDFALLVSEDRRTVEGVATSPDLDSLRLSAQTTIEPPKRKVHWSIIGAIAILTKEILEVVFIKK